MKIRPVGAELFHTGERTERGKDRHDEANLLFFTNVQTRLK